MTNTIAIRKKVAELCGYIDIYREVGFLGELWKGCKKDGLYVILPYYELSLNAIIQAFDEHGFSYTLSKRINEDEKLLGYFAIAGDCDAFSDTASKAMCYLFIKLMEAK